MGAHTGLKVLVYVFDFLLLLCGLALVVGGTVVQVHYNTVLTDLGSKLMIAPMLLIIAGCCIVLIAILGCIGVCKLWSWSLILFAILLGAVFLMEIAGAIAAYTERASVRSYIEDHMNASIAGNATQASGQEMHSSLDELQRRLQCCGVRNFTDWLSTGQKKIPNSCCTSPGVINCSILSPTQQMECLRPNAASNTCPVYTMGCLTLAEDFIGKNSGAIGGIALGVAAFQIIGVVLAACLAKKIRRDSLNP